MTTASIEFYSESRQHLKALEHQLKHIRHVKVDLIEPRDHSAPALIALEMHKEGESAARDVAQVLSDFLHTGSAGQSKISLVTIEGDRIDIAPLSVDEIANIIIGAEESE